jgi:tetratricopeptide (TPR) repeat protein
MLRAVRLCIVPLLILCAACNRDPVSQSRTLVESGNKYYNKSKFKEASILYRKALSKNAKNGEAYYKLGLTELKLQNFGPASQAFRRALDLQPANNDAATKLADIYWLAYASDPRKFKSFLAEIRDLSDGLLKRDPKSFDGLRLAGYLALADQKIPDALAKFEAANQSKPYQPELTMVLVQTLLASNRSADAEALAKNFLARQKNYAPMYDQLLRLYISRSQYAEAEQLLKDKVANNPKQEAFYLQLAGFYLGTQKRPDMESTLQRLLSDSKDFPMAHLTVGRFFFRARDFDRARHEYDEGLKSTPKEKALYQKAIVELLAAQNKNQEAKTIVDEVLKDNPKDAQAIEMRSALLLQGGTPEQIQTAINDLQTLVTKSPENPNYRFELGRAQMAKKLPDQARQNLEEAIRLRPDFVPPKILMAQILSSKGDHAHALQMADEIIRLDPNNLAAHLLRSSALIGIGEKDKAKVELDQILKVAPNSTDAKFQLGLINYNEKNYKQADAIFRQMQTMNPADTRGIMGVIETQVAQRDFDDAIKSLDAELVKDPKRQDYRLALANVQVRAQRYDSAIQDYQALIANNNKSADIYTRLGETYRLKGDINAAIENFRKASALAPNDAVPLTRMAMLLDGIGRRNEAKPLYEQILRISPDEPVALNNLAYIKAEEGTDLDQALAFAQRAKQKLPQDPNISDTLGWVYLKKNLSDNAISVFRDLVTKEPKNPTYRYHLGMALMQKGDRPTAKKELEVALQNNPSREEQGKIRELISKIG